MPGQDMAMRNNAVANTKRVNKSSKTPETALSLSDGTNTFLQRWLTQKAAVQIEAGATVAGLRPRCRLWQAGTECGEGAGSGFTVLDYSVSV